MWRETGLRAASKNIRTPPPLIAQSRRTDSRPCPRLRLQPVLPFNILNYALGLTSISLRDYMLASWIGMFPATVLYVYLGSIMNDISDLLRGRPNSGMAGRLLVWGGLAAIVVLVWWLGRIANKALREEMGPDARSGVKQ